MNTRALAMGVLAGFVSTFFTPAYVVAHYFGVPTYIVVVFAVWIWWVALVFLAMRASGGEE